MAVRNVSGLGPSRNVKPIPIIHIIPPKFSPVWKIEIVTDTESIDITELIFNGEFSDGVTESIGDFSFRITDPNNTITNKIEEFDTINIYLDYGNVATTLKFKGKIERKSNVDQIWLDISGRSIAMITTGVNITYNSNGQKTRKQILIDVINKYFIGIIDTSGIEDDDITLDVNYSEIPFWDFIQELCEGSGRDAYIGTNFVFNYFEINSRQNSTEAIVENINLVETQDYAKDTQEIVTQVRTYGRSNNGVPIISSSISDTTNTKGIIKERKIDNSNLLTPKQCKEFSVLTAESNKDAPTLGKISSLMTPTILPGESLFITNPTNNIPPAYYKISSYRHIFSNEDSPKTEFTIAKPRLDTALIFRKIFQSQSYSSDNINPSDMDDTILYDYNSNYGKKLFNDGTYSNTITDVDNSTGIGGLKVLTGETGTWTSKEINVGGILTGVSLRHSSSNIEGTKFFISLNSGVSFKEIISTADNIVFDGTQDSIILRVDIKSSKTIIEAIGLYYKF